QREVGYAVSLSDILPGDIVCYSGHVGIYAGNNTLIHASNEKSGITLTSPVTYRKVLAVRRIF
ncbi:MAG: C40 family peptidase, partial [Roseburia sp.]